MHTVLTAGFKLVVFLLLCVQTGVGLADIWKDVETAEKALEHNFGAVYYRALRADHDALRQVLAAAPMEFTSSQGAEIILPLPDGSMQRFELVNSPVMAPELAARYVEIQTYRVRGLDDPTTTGRLDMTPKGFHAMLSNSLGTVYIDPDERGAYRSYYRRDYVTASKGLIDGASRPICLVESATDTATAFRPTDEFAQRISGSRRVYRLALAATGEYTQFHGGTVAEALAAMVTAINRVNQVYGRDVAIQFVLVSNNDSIIYTDPGTDPYTNNDGFEMLDENQANLDAVIGSINYDIGHVFSTGGGGIALVGGTCRTDHKAKGVTGRPDPVDDVFYIDLVAHEMGHQMNAAHSFNGTTNACADPNRVPDSAVEPGSGSTIMSYAGICGVEDLQAVTDATFHAMSIQQIVDFSTSNAGAGCGVLETTGNTAPTVNAGSDYVIPRETPYTLIGSATDPEGDVLSYQWDEMDVGGDTYATDAASFGDDLGGNPLFRSFLPKDMPQRVFPRLSSVLAGELNPLGETLPTTDRALNFRLTVRDGESGISEDDVVISVDTTQGPFAVTGGTLNVYGSYPGGSDKTIDWSVNNTVTDCPEVDISLVSFSQNGATYCDASDDTALHLGTHANTGNAAITLPDKAVARGRVHIACSNNIFFTLSSADIEVTSSAGEVADDCQGIDGTVMAHGVVFNEADEGTTVLPSDDGGGGGAIFLLPVLLGFRAAGLSLKKRRRSNA